MADGESVEEAVENLNSSKREWIETSLELGRTIPEPTTDEFSGQLRVRMPKSLHRTLSQIAKDENISLNQLIVHQLSKGIGHRF